MLVIRTPPQLPRRAAGAHKGDFGRVLVVGGSRGMIGAPALAANAALRAGAGLATLACPADIQLAAATLCPCATSIPLPQTPHGRIHPKRTEALLRTMVRVGDETAPSVIAAGMGLGRGNPAFSRSWVELFREWLRAGIALVLDADGLNALPPSRRSAGAAWRDVGFRRAVITPHPGELARLLDVSTRAVQANRQEIAVETANRMCLGKIAPDSRPVVVLKGAGTIVTDGTRVYTNKSGNPGMATGGSGDVLSGVIAGLIAQSMSCFDAAVLGVHVHGVAGDLAAKEMGMVGLIAADLVDHLPFALRQSRAD